MDEQGQPSMFHEAVTESMAGRTMRNFNDFESVLVSASRAGGTCVRKRHEFKESRELHTLRFFFFFLAPFCCRNSVLDCCTGQRPGKGNERTVWIVNAPGQSKTERSERFGFNFGTNKNSELEDVEGEYNFSMQNILETPSRNTSSIAPNSFGTK